MADSLQCYTLELPTMGPSQFLGKSNPAPLIRFLIVRSTSLMKTLRQIRPLHRSLPHRRVQPWPDILNHQLLIYFHNPRPPVVHRGRRFPRSEGPDERVTRARLDEGSAWTESCPDHTTVSVRFVSAVKLQRLWSEIDVGPPHFSLKQPEMHADGWCQ